MPRAVSEQEVEQVFEAWRRRQRRPTVCRLTEDRVDLIRSRLAKGYTVEDLGILFDYAWEARDPDARFWRGDNSRGRTYLDLANLLRAGKLAGRIEKARIWHERRHADALDFAGPFQLATASPSGVPTGAAREDLDDSFGPFRLVRSEEIPADRAVVVAGSTSGSLGLFTNIGGAE